MLDSDGAFEVHHTQRLGIKVRGLLDREYGAVDEDGGQANCVNVSEPRITQRIPRKLTLP